MSKQRQEYLRKKAESAWKAQDSQAASRFLALVSITSQREEEAQKQNIFEKLNPGGKPLIEGELEDLKRRAEI